MRTTVTDATEPEALAIDHRIELFFDFTFNRDEGFARRLAALQLRQVASPNWVHPSRLEDGAQRSIADRPVWEWCAWDVSPDLHPFVHAILNSRMDASEEPSFLRLSSHGANMLAGRYRHPVSEGRRANEARASASLTVSRGAGSQAMPQSTARLPAAQRVADVGLSIVIESVSVHLFSTCFGIAVMTCRAETHDGANLRPADLIEMLPLLCDERGSRKLKWQDAPGGAVADISAASIVRDLMTPAGCVFRERDRTYSFCAVVFDQPLADSAARNLAFRLSRHYNARYRPTPGLAGTFFASPFETVLHAISREGACTIVDRTWDEGARIEYLDTWIQQAHSRVYLPLQVAAFHEHVVLLDLAQGAGLEIKLEAGPTAAAKSLEAKLLKALCERFLVFRLRYRLSQVSALTTHDLAYAATEQALGLAALSEKISRDLLAVERRLIELAAQEEHKAEKQRDERRRRLERLFAPFASISSAGLAYLTFTGAATHLEDATRAYWHGNWFDALAVAIQVVGIFLATVAYFFTWRIQHEGATEPEDPCEHAAVEDAFEDTAHVRSNESDRDQKRT